MLYYKNRLIIPKTLRKEMIDRTHEGHAGIVKCNKRGRKVMYWPDMSCDIEKYVSEYIQGM